MKRKAAALILGLLVLLQVAMPPAGAAGAVCFVAAGEYVLSVTDETMPFWSNGYLYISSSIFTGTARESLNVSRGYDKAADAVVLYRSEKEALVFELSKNYAWDANNKSYYPGAIRRNGTIFVPASLVAKFFGLQYSYTEVEYGHMVWLRQPEALQLPDRVFVDAASLAMEERYNEYQKSKGVSVTPQTPAGSAVAVTGKAVYLCLRAGEDTAAMLDALGRYNAQAAFFCDLEFMRDHGAELRRMTATGQTIGILADAEDPDMTVSEQVEACSQALEQATCGATRLVRVENGKSADREALQSAGYRCLEEDLDRSGYALRSASHAASLQQRVAARRGSTVVWLADSASAVGLQAFLKAVSEAEGRCLAWTETT